MLDISFLMWTVPGVIGLWAYNRWLSCSLPQVEGWAYLFAVVIFSTPYYFISELLNFLVTHSGLLGTSMLKLGALYSRFVGLFISILVAILLARYVTNLENKYTIPAPDPFYNRCYLWKKKIVFITLKNKKIYLAWLMDYTKDSRFEFTIEIMPICSGYRDSRGKVDWTFIYPFNEKTQEQMAINLVIPQREIVNFSLWSQDKAFIDAPPIDKLKLANP